LESRRWRLAQRTRPARRLGRARMDHARPHGAGQRHPRGRDRL